MNRRGFIKALVSAAGVVGLGRLTGGPERPEPAACSGGGPKVCGCQHHVAKRLSTSMPDRQ